MKKLHLFFLGLFALMSFAAPQAFAQDDTDGIASRYMKHYVHAKAVLEKEAPSFLADFQTLKEEIQTINYSDKEAQLEAIMRFLPAIEEMNDLTTFDYWDKSEGHRTLQYEVIFTFFSIHLPMADNHYTTIMKLFCDAFMTDGIWSESIRMLTEDELVAKYNMTHEEALRIVNIWDQLHRNWPW